MKFYSYGDPNKPTILIIPGTCCTHSLFDHLIPYLTETFFVEIASFDGFDETEHTTYSSSIGEVEQIEQHIAKEHDGNICCIYGCSLGGSLGALLVSRRKVHTDHLIIGSSDMDQLTGPAAWLESQIFTSMVFHMLQKGQIPSWMLHRLERKLASEPGALEHMKKLLGSIDPVQLRSVISRQSIYNQFHSDLVTPVPDHIDVPGTTIHVFYALRMGKKYRTRYLQHFAHPDIREQDMGHEMFVSLHPKEWAAEVIDCCKS